MTSCILISTTCDQQSRLDFIARELVHRQLAACVQIGGPVTSVYRWQGKVDSAEEWTCTIKTVVEREADVVALVKDLHPYDEPEVVVTPITGGSESYLRWLRDQVKNQP